MKKEVKEIHEWTCPICKIVVKSLYENQFDYNKKQHEDSHKRGKEAKK